MRVCCVAALAAFAAYSYQSHPVREPITVIVDSEASLANGGVSAALRAQLLSQVERLGTVSYFDLTTAASKPVPASARESFLLALDSVRPRAQTGVSVTFNEATAILRKNEAVRDAVILRECSASPARGCASGVHVAATTLVDDVELAGRQKLRHLVGTASPRGGTLFVLVTAGWPYRDEQRLRLTAAVDDLRRVGARLVIVRLPGLVTYQGLVRDATESLASRVAATFIALNDERDAARVHDALSAQTRPEITATPEVTTSEPSPPRPSATDPTPRPTDLSDELLRRAADYVDTFERTFSSVIWRERYQQEVRVQRRFGASGTSFTTLAARRLLDSELFFLWLPRDASWIAVRDVLAVDGKPRRAADRPLQGVLKSDSVTVDQLKRLAAANGRFNIGSIVRTFNEPTLALLFLDAQYRRRFAFTRRGEQTVNGEPATMYEFVESGRPTVIRDQDRDLPVRGTYWIDPASGRVLQTSLQLADSVRRLDGRMTVQYSPNPKFDVLVPLEMRERYTSASGEEVTAVATYSDFRRFEATSRLK